MAATPDIFSYANRMNRALNNAVNITILALETRDWNYVCPSVGRTPAFPGASRPGGWPPRSTACP